MDYRILVATVYAVQLIL